MRQKLFVFTAIFYCLSFSQILLSDDGKNTDTVLDTITVTAGRLEESTKKLSVKPLVISRDDIERSRSLNLSDLLANNGIQLTAGRTTMVQSAPKIRGFGNNQTYGPDSSGNVLILLNGRRSGLANMSKFPTKNIERIEVVRGPAAVQYGSSAIGGVVNIITKRGTEDTQASFSVGAGSWDRSDIGGEFSSAKGPLDFSFGFYQASMNDNYTSAKGDKVDGSYIDFMRNISTNIGYNFNANNRLGLIVNASDNKFGQVARNAITKNNPFESRDKNCSFDFIYDGALESGRLSWQIRYYTGTDQYEEYQSTKRDNRIEYYHTDIQGFQSQLTTDLHELNTTLTAGFDWFEYDVEQRAKPNNYKQDDAAAFLLAKTRLLDERLFLSAGVRYDAFSNKAEGNERTFYKTTPTFGVAYLPVENLKLRANYTRGYRVPSVWESISDTRGNPGPTNNIIPNAGLKPQQATTFEAGVDFSRNFFNASLTYFHTDFKDKLSWVSNAYRDKNNVRYGQYVNRDQARIEGFELESSFDLGGAFDQEFILKPYLTATFMSRYQEQDSKGQWIRMQNMPQWYMSWGIIFDHPAWDLKTRLHMNTQTSQKANATLTTGGWTKSSFSFSKGLIDFDQNGTIRLVGEVDNLFNRDYSIYRNTTDSLYTMPGRSFYLGLSYEFK